MTHLNIQFGDLTLVEADAIVNAANTELRPGTGVDGAIHKAAGPKLALACRDIGKCKTGKAVITPGFRLLSKFVIHTPTPVIEQEGSEELLYQCYQSALELAHTRGLRTIAFPMLGAGSGGGFPPQMAADIAIRAIMTFIESKPEALGIITLVAFKKRLKENFDDALSNYRTN